MFLIIIINPIIVINGFFIILLCKNDIKGKNNFILIYLEGNFLTGPHALRNLAIIKVNVIFLAF